MPGASLFQEDGEDADHLSHFSGLFQRRPLLAIAMGVFMLSLTRLPLGGFAWAALTIFLAAVRSGHVGLAVVMGVAAVIGAAYYLKVIVAMFFRAPERSLVDNLKVPLPAAVAVALAVAGTVVLGVAPSLVLGPLSRVHVGIALLP
ncbi:MAG: proton-conducting transporter membrane subunit [Acidobacteriota bacterium]|nr:proton-conducting transporter membrane subunit [Acidobacteriota bacterium]